MYSEPYDGFAGRLTGERGDVVLDTETREPEEAIALLSAAGWDDATEDWVDQEDDV